MTIYKFEKYRLFLKYLISTYPRKGYGQLYRLSKHLGVNSAYLTQVFNELKSLNIEQALSAAEYFNFTNEETRYFLLLVQYDRAGTKKLKDFYYEDIRQIQNKNRDLKNKIHSDIKIEPIKQVIFYSDWTYSAVRQCTAISGLNQVEAIAKYLNIETKRVIEILSFLTEVGLCETTENGFKIGARRTHLEDSSPLKKLHHQNWRSKAMEKCFDNWEHRLHYSSPMTISNKDAFKIREIILDMIEMVNLTADNSKSEELVCFNVDWFKI